MWWWWLVTTTFDSHHYFFKVEFIPNTNFFLYFGQENRSFLATRSVLWPKICRKCDSGRPSAPDAAGGVHNAPPDPLVSWGVDTPPHTPPHSAPLAPRCSRLCRLDRCVPLRPWHQILVMPLVTTTFLGKVAPLQVSISAATCKTIYRIHQYCKCHVYSLTNVRYRSNTNFVGLICFSCQLITSALSVVSCHGWTLRH